MTTQGEMNMAQGQQPAETTLSLYDGSAAQSRIEKSKGIVQIAHQVCDPYVDQLLHVEWGDVPESDIKAVDEQLSILEGRIIAAISKIDEQYKPLSKLWDAFRSNFTGDKENLELLRNKVKFPRIKMANELDARIKRANEDKEKAINVAKEEIDVATAFNQHMMYYMFESIRATTQKMYKAFLETGADRFELFVNNLTNWHPSNGLNADTIKKWVSSFKWSFKYMQPIEPTYDAQQWIDAIVSRLMPEREKLLKMVPLRREQLAKNAVDNNPFAELYQAAGMSSEQEAQQATEQIKTVQAAATTNATYEVSSSVVIPEQNKGVKKNHVLAPATHEEWKAVVAFWMEKRFPHSNQAELNKRLGFMLTAANTIMKATGEMPKGDITTVEAFSTRAGKR